MWFSGIGVIALPPIAFIITKRLCLSLQLADRDLVLHGKETGRPLRMPSGEFVEVHEPNFAEKAWLLTSHEQLAPLELPLVDENGVKRPKLLLTKLLIVCQGIMLWHFLKQQNLNESSLKILITIILK